MASDSWWCVLPCPVTSPTCPPGPTARGQKGRLVPSGSADSGRLAVGTLATLVQVWYPVFRSPGAASVPEWLPAASRPHGSRTGVKGIHLFARGGMGLGELRRKGKPHLLRCLSPPRTNQR